MSDPSPRIDAIFLEALDLEGTAREDYLDQACGGDASLRRDVELLLANAGRMGDFLQQPAYTPADASRPAEPIELAGQTLGPYKLLQKIGEGGMGVVYLAEQEAPVRRRVAIKAIRSGMDSARVVARFDNERQALALMDHPNIARVLDAGVTPDGRPYFAMELVHGVPITRYCDEQQLSVDARIRLFIPVCRAVQHAHQKGIIHRDLKPSNVLIGLYDGQPIPKVIDFGVAKAIEQRLAERTMVTELGQIIGTMEYMAPEQAERDNLDIDTRADIYTLGVLLYELLTGSPPFSANELRAAGLGQMLRILKEVEPIKPSTKITSAEDLPRVAANRRLEPGRLARLVRGELDWITMKCLEKTRSRRYETANGLAQDLERFLADEPVQACPPTAGYRLRKFASKHRGVLTGLAFLALLLTGFSVFSGWQAMRAEALRRQAQRNFEDANRNLDLAVGAVDQFCIKVSEDPRLKEHDLRPLRQDLLRTAVEYQQRLLDLREKSDVARVDLARSYYRLASLTKEIEAKDRAIELYRLAITEYDALLINKPADTAIQFELARCLAEIAVELSTAAHAEPAQQSLDRSIEILNSLLTTHPDLPGVRIELARAFESQSFIRSMTRQFDKAEVYSRQAVEQWSSLSAAAPQDATNVSHLAHSHLRLGEAIYAQGLKNWRAAEAEFQTALTLQRKALELPSAEANERRVLAVILRSLGRTAMVTRRIDQAQGHLHEAQGIFEQLQQDEPSVVAHEADVGMIFTQIAGCEDLSGDQAARKTALQAAVLRLESAIRRDSENTVWATHLAESLGILGIIASRSGDSEEALSMLDRSIHVLEGILDREPDSRNANNFLPHNLVERGRLQAKLGRYDAALADMDRAVAMAQDTMRNSYRLNRAAVLALSGAYDRAVDETGDALAALARETKPHILANAYVRGAENYAKCSERVASDTQISDDERAQQANGFAEHAVLLLKSAIDAGFDDREALRQSPELAVLRNRPDFVALLAQ